MIFGLGQEDGSLITPMALAHPLHPIDNSVEEQAPTVGWMMCFLLMTLVPVQKLCVNIYLVYVYTFLIRVPL